jgi:hypothetical protein
LRPEECRANLIPFTRSGGTSIGGNKAAVRTDLGFWSVELVNVPIAKNSHRKAWDAISQILGGSSVRMAIPVWGRDTAPYASGNYEAPVTTLHSDGTASSDGATYVSGAISAVTSGVTAIGATTITINVIKGGSDFTGSKFSYNHALYQTGQVVSIVGTLWTVRISPSVRETIPAGSDLNFDQPTCICRLVDDRGMDRGVNADNYTSVTVKFQEDTDYWGRLAAGLDV